MRVTTVTAMMAMATLGACGGGSKEAATNAAAANASAAANVAEAAVAGGPMDCSKLPDFVPLYAGAKVQTCVAGGGVDPGHESGTAIFTVDATPKAIIGWYKQKADAAGLAPALSTDTMYAAREGSKRSLMVLITEQKVGTKVTLNWGRDL